MFDLMIKGGTVVTPETSVAADVAIKDGKIAAVASPGTLGSEAGRVIDAAGKVHRIEERTEPFSTEPIFSDGPVQGILEVKAGTARTIGLKPGDEVILPGLDAAPKP